MSTNKRGRGRPPGTGLDDSPTLRKVADLIAANPSLKPTTAIKRVLERPTDTAVRRLQGKWKEHGPRYRAEAQARRSVPATRRASRSHAPRTARQIFEAHRRMQDALGPAMTAAQEMMNSTAMREAQEAFRRYHESPAMRAIQEFQNSPTMKAMLEIQNSPTMRAMRELEASPTMRAIREAQAHIGLLDDYY